MLLVTTERIAGREIEPLGIVEGSSVQTVHAGKDIMNSLKTLVGGELTSYTEMMEKARTLATDKMVRNAEQLLILFFYIESIWRESGNSQKV